MSFGWSLVRVKRVGVYLKDHSKDNGVRMNTFLSFSKRLSTTFGDCTTLLLFMYSSLRSLSVLFRPPFLSGCHSFMRVFYLFWSRWHCISDLREILSVVLYSRNLSTPLLTSSFISFFYRRFYPVFHFCTRCPFFFFFSCKTLIRSNFLFIILTYY